jgi:isoamylase
MLLAGDEVLRSQGGNNNVWCQDNPKGWFDWSLTRTNAPMLRFVSELIALRRRHPSLRRRRFLSGRTRRGAALPDIAWHGPTLEDPGWEDAEVCCLAFTLAGRGEAEEHIHVMMNMSEEPQTFALPPVPGRVWHRAVDTAREGPEDILLPSEQPPVKDSTLRVDPRSLVVLEAR